MGSAQRSPCPRPARSASTHATCLAVQRVSSLYLPPEALSGRHDVGSFRCRSAEQTEWLHRHARGSASMGTTRVFVVTEHAGNQVVAYYAWCMAQVQPDKATERLRKGAGRYPQPVALLARLGVDTGHEGRGLGVGLLQDVFARLLELSADIGCRGLIVHAESPEAREFYLHLVPEFEPSPTDDLSLIHISEPTRQAEISYAVFC